MESGNLHAAVWCYLDDEAVEVLLRVHEWHFPRQAGSCQIPRYAVSIGPSHVVVGVLTPPWIHEATTPKPCISQVSNDDPLLAFEIALLVDAFQNFFSKCNPTIVFQPQASLCCRQRFATLDLLFAAAAAAGA